MEFKNRPECLLRHELRDKLVVLDKVEKTMHKKLDATEILGPKISKEQSYYDSIARKAKPRADVAILKEPFARRPINTFHDDGKALQRKVQLAKQAQRDKMVHSYRDRLFTRFKV